MKKNLQEVTKKVVSDKVVKSLLEKMRISGTNMWTSIADVTTSPKEVQQLQQMITNGLLTQENNLIRFIDNKVFSIIDKHVK